MDEIFSPTSFKYSCSLESLLNENIELKIEMVKQLQETGEKTKDMIR